MADADFRTKDGSISDAISAAGNGYDHKIDEQNFEEKQDCQEPESSELKNVPALESKKSMENDKTAHNGDAQLPNNSSSINPCGRVSPNSYTQELDLTDPKSVIDMLENVDLTEEDTEDLLQEAYKMNRKLKEMLRRQDENRPESKPKSKSKSKTNTGSRSVNGLNSKSGSATSSSDNSRVGSSFGVRKVLPPINAVEREGTSVYAIKLRRSKTNVQDTKPVLSDSSLVRSKSSMKPMMIRKDSESPTRRKKAAGQKPEWNDRFNYT